MISEHNATAANACCQKLLGKLMKKYQDQEILSYIGGAEIEAEILQIFKEQESRVVCLEIGSKAELNRLKNYLGETLPANWEALRFNKVCATHHQ